MGFVVGNRKIEWSLVVLLLCFAAMAAALPAYAAENGKAEADQPLIVRDVAVQGNVEISTDKILAAVKETKVGEELDRDKVQKDVNHIAELGYFQNVEAKPVAYRDGVKVTFVVEEFPVVQDVKVTVKGDVVSGDQVMGLLDVTKGKVLNARDFGKSIDDLHNASGEKLGYVLRPTNVGFGGDKGDILEVDVAPVRIGEIRIEGNEKTKENVIRRELALGSGDVLSLDDLRLSLRKLGQLGYFEPIVPEFVSTKDPLVVDILLPVVEDKTGRAAFGAGYSSSDGLVGYIEASDRNFLGRGETANIRWEFGKKKNSYDLGFTEPYLFGTDTTAGINLYDRLNRRQQYDGNTAYPYTERRLGGDVTLGRPLGSFTKGYVTLKLENASVDPDSQPSPVSPNDNRTRSVIFNTKTDTTDHLFFPTDGFRSDFSVEKAGHFLGGDTRFTKLNTSFSKFIKAGRNNQTWAFRVMSGYGFGTLPLQEQFRVGGSDTVRGYRYGEFQGDRMVVAQGEYRFPISEKVHGVVFVDAGNAWNNKPIDLGDLKTGYGLGIRFNTPLGIMRIDYGIGEGGGNAYFSLGPSF